MRPKIHFTDIRGGLGASLVASTALLLAACSQANSSNEQAASDTVAGQSANINAQGEDGSVPGAGPQQTPDADSSSNGTTIPASEASTANSRIPAFKATCGSGIAVRAEAGGPVFIDDAQAILKKFNENYFEASRAGTTVSITFETDGSPSLSYTGPNRTNGVCRLN
jgi:hypothetical protein